MPRWSNWAGTVRFAPAVVERPSTLEAIQKVVLSSVAAGRQVRVAGSGHSYSALVETTGTLITLDDYQGLESVDLEAGEATILGGTKLRRLGPLLKAAGVAMINLGDTDAQSLAGAVSTGTHGSGLDLGSLSHSIAGLTLVTADGEVVECSRDKDSDLLRAAAVSLGALGVIAKVRLKVLPGVQVAARQRQPPARRHSRKHRPLDGRQSPFRVLGIPLLGDGFDTHVEPDNRAIQRLEAEPVLGEHRCGHGRSLGPEPGRQVAPPNQNHRTSLRQLEQRGYRRR
jgi:hypothetical protein